MKYLALLRGINVSGQKIIKMAALREQLSELGFLNVVTYIQSGNIIFEFDQILISELEEMIHEKIKKDYGFEVPVWVKTASEMGEVTGNNPLQSEANEDPKRMLVTFLAEEPAEEHVLALRDQNLDPEIWILQGKNIYLFVPNGYGNAKLSNNFIERKLKVRATTRNWKSVEVLAEMLKE